jgi:hypothetical protein
VVADSVETADAQNACAGTEKKPKKPGNPSRQYPVLIITEALSI